ncbi:unnamed protein product [Trichogramma brassicae]|uniref:Ig-like domain-containing protein n=1 Tax=Trichogramma brassicae TaxID=86971 RepID=A0A6H5IBA2_9HYME|nr:unnamed protein product [Trichogramma brassicae]
MQETVDGSTTFGFLSNSPDEQSQIQCQSYSCSLQIVIKKVNIPATVESGDEYVILDCDYDLAGTSPKGLVVKWYLNNYELVYQWIYGILPQASDLIMKYIDLDYKASSDNNTMYRAMKFVRPSIELTGNYTCQISTWQHEVTQTASMIVYSTGQEDEFKLWHTKTNGEDDDGKEFCTSQCLKSLWFKFQFSKFSKLFIRINSHNHQTESKKRIPMKTTDSVEAVVFLFKYKEMIETQIEFVSIETKINFMIIKCLTYLERGEAKKLTCKQRLSLFVHPGGLFGAARYKYNLVDDFPQQVFLFLAILAYFAPGSRDVFATLSTQMAYSVHQVQIQLRRHFSPRKSRFSRYFDTPGGLFGAPGTNTAPTTTFSQEVEMFSLLCPPRWPIRCTRYKYNLVDDFPQGSRDVFATLSTWVAYSVH